VEAVRQKMRNTAFLVPGVQYVLRRATEDEISVEVFHFPNGLLDMVDFLSPSDEKAVSGTLVISGEGTYKENAAVANGVMRSNVWRSVDVEVALRLITGCGLIVVCYTNTYRNQHGGTYRKGFERGVLCAINAAI